MQTGTLRPRRSPKLDHLCSDRVVHPRHRTLARKPQMGKALSSSAPLGRWLTLREHTRVISRECRSFTPSDPARASFLVSPPNGTALSGGRRFQPQGRRGLRRRDVSVNATHAAKSDRTCPATRSKTSERRCLSERPTRDTTPIPAQTKTVHGLQPQRLVKWACLEQYVLLVSLPLNLGRQRIIQLARASKGSRLKSHDRSLRRSAKPSFIGRLPPSAISNSNSPAAPFPAHPSRNPARSVRPRISSPVRGTNPPMRSVPPGEVVQSLP